MNNDLLHMSPAKLQRVITLRKQLDRLQSQLERLVLGNDGAAGTARKPARRRTMSASARKRIAAAKKAWWAERKAGKK